MTRCPGSSACARKTAVDMTRLPIAMTTMIATTLALALLLSSSAWAGDEKAAADLEAKAFAAVDAKQWCEAVALFLAADQNAPSLDLVVDAAQAAEQGGDRAKALSLYAGALARMPD